MPASTTMIELEIIEGIKRGLADVTAGRVVSHEQVMSEAREIISAAKRSTRQPRADADHQ
jgi:predicted transcriptional regulator